MAGPFWPQYFSHSTCRHYYWLFLPPGIIIITEEKTDMDNHSLSEFNIKEIVFLLDIFLNQNEVRYITDRPRMGLIFVSKGRLNYECNDKRYVSDQTHALLLPQGSEYKVTCTEESLSHLIDFTVDPPADIPEIISFSIGSNMNYLKTFRYIDYICTFNKISYKLKSKASLYDIMARLNETVFAPYMPNYRLERILPSIEYMEKNYIDTDMTIKLLASKSNISAVYFRKTFTGKYGVSPIKYVHMKRIEKAKDMLRSGIMSVTGISEATGFNSVYHFSRAFKKMTGYSPTDYVKNCKSNDNVFI